MKELEVSGGVTLETAQAVCAQYGAGLVTASSLDQRTDLLDQVREERRSQCWEEGRGGLGYWLRPEEGERCRVWVADTDLLSVPGQFTLTSVPCNLTTVNTTYLQPLCLKTDQEEEAGHGGHFLGYILQSLLSLRSRRTEAPACPPQMRRSGERCLLMAQEVMDYQEARDHCQEQGLDLVTVNTEEEVEEVRRLVEYQERSDCETIEGWWVVNNSPADHSLWRSVSFCISCPHSLYLGCQTAVWPLVPVREPSQYTGIVKTGMRGSVAW